MVNITDVSPLPVNVTVDDAPTAANLIRPLVKVWGGKVRTVTQQSNLLSLQWLQLAVLLY
jgi:hypothetical protein